MAKIQISPFSKSVDMFLSSIKVPEFFLPATVKEFCLLNSSACHQAEILSAAALWNCPAFPQKMSPESPSSTVEFNASTKYSWLVLGDGHMT